MILNFYDIELEHIKFKNDKNELNKQIKILEEEEGTKELAQLENGLNQEEQLFKASEKGYLYGVKKLLNEANIEAKDNNNYKRRIDKDGQH